MGKTSFGENGEENNGSNNNDLAIHSNGVMLASTDDTHNIGFWLLIAGISLVGLLFAITLGKNSRPA